MSFLTDFRYAFRSLMRVKGLAATVIVTLALGIGANAAIFSVVRGVLLKPLVNRDEDRLIYIRQSAQGLGQDSVVFSVPEIQDLRARVTTLDRLRRVLDHRVHDGRPGRAARRAGRRRQRVVLRRHGPEARPRPPARAGRRRPERRRRRRADAPVLDHHAERRPVGDRQDGAVRRAHGDHRRRARAVGALPVRDRDDRQRRHQPAPPGGRDGDRPRAPDDRAVRAAAARPRSRGGAGRAARRARRDDEGPPRGLPEEGRLPRRCRAAARPDCLAGPDGAARAAGRLRARLHHRVLERRQPDPGPIGAAGRRAGDPRDARRQRLGAASHAAGREPAAVRRRRDPRRGAGAADGGAAVALRGALLRARPRADGRRQPAVGRRGAGAAGGRAAGVRAAPADRGRPRRPRLVDRRRAHHVRHQPPPAPLRRHADRRVVRAAGRRRHAARRRCSRCRPPARRSRRATC